MSWCTLVGIGCGAWVVSWGITKKCGMLFGFSADEIELETIGTPFVAVIDIEATGRELWFIFWEQTYGFLGNWGAASPYLRALVLWSEVVPEPAIASIKIDQTSAWRWLIVPSRDSNFLFEYLNEISQPVIAETGGKRPSATILRYGQRFLRSNVILISQPLVGRDPRGLDDFDLRLQSAVRLVR